MVLGPDHGLGPSYINPGLKSVKEDSSELWSSRKQHGGALSISSGTGRKQLCRPGNKEKLPGGFKLH
uniref:Uncharacterized protein n=1 Tax=Crocodylus porosus TaxID=8502 RepID=A0A7M4E488_CROPO